MRLLGLFVCSLPVTPMAFVYRCSCGKDADAQMWVDVTHQHGVRAGWKPLRKDAAQ